MILSWSYEGYEAISTNCIHVRWITVGLGGFVCFLKNSKKFYQLKGDD